MYMYLLDTFTKACNQITNFSLQTTVFHINPGQHGDHKLFDACAVPAHMQKWCSKIIIIAYSIWTYDVIVT